MRGHVGLQLLDSLRFYFAAALLSEQVLLKEVALRMRLALVGDCRLARDRRLLRLLGAQRLLHLTVVLGQVGAEGLPGRRVVQQAFRTFGQLRVLLLLGTGALQIRFFHSRVRPYVTLCSAMIFMQVVEPVVRFAGRRRTTGHK